jgi:hypothetical protein
MTGLGSHECFESHKENSHYRGENERLVETIAGIRVTNECSVGWTWLANCRHAHASSKFLGGGREVGVPRVAQSQGDVVPQAAGR